MRRSVESYASSQAGSRLLKMLRLGFLAAIILWLAHNLIEVGWQSVWDNLPTQLLFYLLFLLLFISAPFADILIYRYTWRFDVWKNIPAFVKKRILNTDVVGYSGEVYFFIWARRYINLSDLRIGETIRDYNILSALASNCRAVLFLLIFSYWAHEQLVALIGSANPIYFFVTGIVIVILIPIVIRYRRYIFGTPLKRAAMVFGVYFLRLTLGTVLQIAMWVVVIPEVTLVTWIIYSAVSILVSHIPISNKKLIFVGVGTEMAPGLGVAQGAILGLLLTIAALEKVLNLVLYAAFSVSPRFKNRDFNDPFLDSKTGPVIASDP